jgi:hypothetical protein
MAAELRPALKLMEMIKQRSLHLLQEIVHRDMLEANVPAPTIRLISHALTRTGVISEYGTSRTRPIVKPY